MRLSESLTNTEVLTWLIDHMIGYRERKGYIKVADQLPKIQIKGLAADISKFRTGYQDLKTSMAALVDAKSDFKQDIVDATAQLTSMRQDLRFELEQLGNGGGSSSIQSDAQTVTTADVAPLTTGSAASTELGH